MEPGRTPRLRRSNLSRDRPESVGPVLAPALVRLGGEPVQIRALLGRQRVGTPLSGNGPQVVGGGVDEHKADGLLVNGALWLVLGRHGRAG